MRTLAGIWIFLALPATADVVCVRNMLAGGTNVCESFPDRFAYLVPADPNQTIETCVMRRPASMCSSQKDFTEVVSATKEIVCVLQWNTGSVDYCAEYPDKYSYVFRHGSP